MVVHQILIVDDKKEARRQMKELLETLDLDIRVASVPSGEEALLELRSTRFDLLITDFQLPGINGFELLKKTKNRVPELAVILILSKDQTRLPRDWDQTAASAYLSEPVDPADFLDAVERSLGIAGLAVSSRKTASQEEQDKHPENIADRLTRLRQTLQARTCLVLDNAGAILTCAGALPEEIFDGLLMQPVFDSFLAGMKVARSLQSTSPFTFQYFSGPAQDLILASVGQKNALLVILDPINLPYELSDIVLTISEGVDDVNQILRDLGIDRTQEMTQDQEVEDQDIFVDEAELQLEEPRLEALFQVGEINTPQTGELDAFWRTITEEETANKSDKADMLTYEQALQLGLAPEELEDE